MGKRLDILQKIAKDELEIMDRHMKRFHNIPNIQRKISSDLYGFFSYYSQDYVIKERRGNFYIKKYEGTSFTEAADALLCIELTKCMSEGIISRADYLKVKKMAKSDSLQDLAKAMVNGWRNKRLKRKK